MEYVQVLSRRVSVDYCYLPGSAIDPSPKYSLLPPVWGGYGERVEAKEELANTLEVAVKKVEEQFVLLDVSCTP